MQYILQTKANISKLVNINRVNLRSVEKSLASHKEDVMTNTYGFLFLSPPFRVKSMVYIFRKRSFSH